MHNLQIARFYYDVKYSTGKGGLKGSQSRLKEITDKYPCFSFNDEVFYRLATTYQAEEEPDEAARYYQKLGAFGITTNRPGWLRKKLESKAAEPQLEPASAN